MAAVLEPQAIIIDDDVEPNSSSSSSSASHSGALSLDDDADDEKLLPDTIITLKFGSSPIREHTVTFQQVKLSETAMVMLEGAKRNVAQSLVLTFATVEHARVPELLVEYLRHHDGKRQPLCKRPNKSRQMTENVRDCGGDVWDAHFIDEIVCGHEADLAAAHAAAGGDSVPPIPSEHRGTLYALVLAANYMSCQSLLYLCSSKIATTIKGETLIVARERLVQPDESRGDHVDLDLEETQQVDDCDDQSDDDGEAMCDDD